MLHELGLMALALVIRTFAFEPFTVLSGSMMPGLSVGDWFMAYKLPYTLGIAGIERGRVIIYRATNGSGSVFVSRIIGLAGDRVQIRDGILYLNGVSVPRAAVGEREIVDGLGRREPVVEYIETLPGGVQYRILEQSDEGPLDNTPIYVVPQDHSFALGDNRDNSVDSRVPATGFIPLGNLIGAPVWID